MMMHDSASCHTIIPTYFLHTKYHAVVIETFFMSSNRLCPHPWSQIQPPSDTPRFGDISQRHTWNSSWETLYWKKYLPNHRWRDRGTVLVLRGCLLEILPPSWNDLLLWHRQLIKTPDSQSRKRSKGIAESALQAVRRFNVEGLEMAHRNAQQIWIEPYIIHYVFICIQYLHVPEVCLELIRSVSHRSVFAVWPTFIKQSCSYFLDDVNCPQTVCGTSRL